MEIAGADDMNGKPEVRVGKTRNRGDVARLLFGNCWYMGQTTQRIWGQKLGRTFGWLAAWAWTIIAGGGGLGLLIKLGPLPLTNGWFALFSGISACPLTASLLKRYTGIALSGWARFAIAFLIIVVGRLVLKIEGRGTFLIDLSRCWKEGCF